MAKGKSQVPVNTIEDEDEDELLPKIPAELDDEQVVSNYSDDIELFIDDGDDEEDEGEDEREVATAKDPSDAINAGFKQLGEQLSRLVQQTQAPQQQMQQHASTQEDAKELEAWRKRVKSGFYDDPLQAVEAFNERFKKTELVPAFQGIMGQINQLGSMLGKQQVKQTEHGRIVLEKWPGEVEAAMKSYNLQGVDAYEKAVSIVAGQHFNEIAAAQNAEARKKQEAEEAAKAEAARNEGRGRNQNLRSSGKREQPKIKLTQKQADQFQKEAEAKGLPLKSYVKWLERRHPERLKRVKK